MRLDKQGRTTQSRRRRPDRRAPARRAWPLRLRVSRDQATCRFQSLAFYKRMTPVLSHNPSPGQTKFRPLRPDRPPHGPAGPLRTKLLIRRLARRYGPLANPCFMPRSAHHEPAGQRPESTFSPQKPCQNRRPSKRMAKRTSSLQVPGPPEPHPSQYPARRRGHRNRVSSDAADSNHHTIAIPSPTPRA
jgi:hypothetical protein